MEKKETSKYFWLKRLHTDFAFRIVVLTEPRKNNLTITLLRRVQHDPVRDKFHPGRGRQLNR